MASERQKEANRRNAAESSGPRSPAGRVRASRNSYRHGFAASDPSNAEPARRVEKLAREIAGNSADPIVLEHARAASRAEFDLAQVRRLKAATINRVLALGRVDPDEGVVLLSSSSGGEAHIISIVNQGSAPQPQPSEEPECTAEAIRRTLPELAKLDRYEHNAFVRRERAMRAIYAAHNFSW